MPKEFTSISVSIEARDKLRAMTYAMTGRLQRRVSISAVIIAAVALAESHPDEMAQNLRVPNGESE